MKPAIVLDRDGVINEDSDAYIRRVEEWIPLPGSIEAIAALSKAGWPIYVATNQSGLARAYYGLSELTAMHDKLRTLVHALGGQIEDIVFCPHRPEDACDCRKPLPGLLDQLSARHGRLQGGYMVGDSRRDLEAGLARGLQPILVLTGKGRLTQSRLADEAELPHLRIYADLAAFARELLQTEGA